jgi:hypothetical protein
MATLASYIAKSLKETVVLMISVFHGNLSFVGDLGFGSELKAETYKEPNKLAPNSIYLSGPYTYTFQYMCNASTS